MFVSPRHSAYEANALIQPTGLGITGHIVTQSYTDRLKFTKSSLSSYPVGALRLLTHKKNFRLSN